jgi:hypothetical protein
MRNVLRKFSRCSALAVVNANPHLTHFANLKVTHPQVFSTAVADTAGEFALSDKSKGS